MKNFFESVTTCDIKDDGSIVTSADIEISSFVSELLKGEHFFSEEEEGSLDFPSYILDPIDGTREFSKGSGECVTSLAFMASSTISDKGSWGWLYAPLNGLEIDSNDSFVAVQARDEDSSLLGMVSRTDHAKGLFDDKAFKAPGIRFVERGSIAFKLGLLSVSACDFVFSATPKNIWDIAAGTVILDKKGYKLFNRLGEVRLLDAERVDGPLLWCKEKNYTRLKYLLEVKR